MISHPSNVFYFDVDWLNTDTNPFCAIHLFTINIKGDLEQ